MEKAEPQKSMEVNDKRQKLNGILLKAIIGILLADAIIGSVFGLVALISGDKVLFEEHKFLIIYAVIADIVFWIMASIKISKRMVEKKQAKEQARIEEEERLERERKEKLEQERIEREKRLEEQRKLDAEKARIDGVNAEIKRISSKYKTTKKISVAETSMFNGGNIAGAIKEVGEAVHLYKEHTLADSLKYNSINKQIDDILSVKKDPDEKLAYLKRKADTLKQLKGERDKVLTRISTRKIDILNESSATVDIDTAFRMLMLSKVCSFDTIDITDLICKEAPKELGFFSYPHKPLMLNYNTRKYCVFSNIILVFNQSGKFIAAIFTQQIKLQLRTKIEEVYISNDKEQKRKYSANDSKLIKKGETHSYWLHTCKDGSPDLRYRDNPRFSSRTDKYEYGEVVFSLSNSPITYRFSSKDAVKSFAKITPFFAGKNTKFDNTDNLLSLIKSVSTTNEIDDIIKKYKASSKKTYYCKLIEQ